MAKSGGKKISLATEKIAELGNSLLSLDGHTKWEVDEIHLTTKNGIISENLVCKWIKNDLGEWELKCFKP